MMIRTLSVLVVLAAATMGQAETILKFDLGTSGFDLALSGNVMATTNDGDAPVEYEFDDEW